MHPTLIALRFLVYNEQLCHLLTLGTAKLSVVRVHRFASQTQL